MSHQPSTVCDVLASIQDFHVNRLVCLINSRLTSSARGLFTYRIINGVLQKRTFMLPAIIFKRPSLKIVQNMRECCFGQTRGTYIEN